MLLCIFILYLAYLDFNVFAKNPAQSFGGWVVRFSGMKIKFTAYNEMGKRINWVKILWNMLPVNNDASCEIGLRRNTTSISISGTKANSLFTRRNTPLCRQ